MARRYRVGWTGQRILRRRQQGQAGTGSSPRMRALSAVADGREGSWWERGEQLPVIAMLVYM